MTRLDGENRAYTFAIAPLALILFACIVGILLRGINPVEYAGLNRYRDSQYLRDIDARCFHLRYWSADQWADNLRRSGLHIVHHHEYLSLPQVRRWESVARNSSGVLYKLCGRKQQPIDIQRRMGVRNARVRLPRFLASFSAHKLDVGSPTGDSLFGCLLIEAIKA